MSKTDERAGGGYIINIAEFLAGGQALPAELAERRKAMLESLSPEEREKEEARLIAEEAAATRLCKEDERSYAAAVTAAEQDLVKRHREIASERKAGTIGTLTEVGRPYRLSAVAVGRILDQHGLRQRVDVDDDRFLTPLDVDLTQLEAASRARWNEFYRLFRPNGPVDPEPNQRRLPLHLLRGVVLEFAIHDFFDSRDYWIAAKVAPLLQLPTRQKR